MFNLLKIFKKNEKKPEKIRDLNLAYYEKRLEAVKEQIEKKDFKFMPIYADAPSVSIVKKEEFLQFDISKLNITKYKKKYELELPHCVYYFYSKKRAMEVQLIWANFLLEYQERNKTNQSNL